MQYSDTRDEPTTLEWMALAVLALAGFLAIVP